MSHYNFSTDASGSSSSSLYVSSDSSFSQRTTLTTQTERSQTIKPVKTPRTPRPGHTLTQVFQNHHHSSHISDVGGSSSCRSDPPHTAHVGGLRAHIHQLLPRHALFHVRVNIHQLASVPLVKGEFGVRWKFKNVKSRKEHKHDKGKSKADGHNADTDDDDEHDHADVDQISMEDSAGGAHNSHGNLPSVVISDSHHSSSTSAASTRPASPSPYAQYLNSDWLPPSYLVHSNSHSSHPDSTGYSTPHGGYAHARGMTPFVKLQDHNIVWEYTLNTVVQMDVNRDTMDLLPNELKLVVMQRVIPGDIDAPHNPRLGAIYLNLAEYAGADSVTRSYLLCQSKTNATLKLTIELEHIGGEKNFKAPLLPKGEILSGVAGILENVYSIRPRALDLYGMYYDREDQDEKQRNGATLRNCKEPFDISNLSSSFGPRTTETLIEAIFNPVPTHSEKESPFTYYVPLEQQDKKPSLIAPGSDIRTNGSGSLRSRSTRSTTTSSEYASVHLSSPSGKALSLSSQSERSSHGDSSELKAGTGGERRKSWWRKIGHNHEI